MTHVFTETGGVGCNYMEGEGRPPEAFLSCKLTHSLKTLTSFTLFHTALRGRAPASQMFKGSWEAGTLTSERVFISSMWSIKKGAEESSLHSTV
jgi:hypothetical protein